jgi:hypothetical protein
VHAAQIARVLRIPTAPFARRRFDKQHRRARFAGHQCSTEGGIAAADYKNVYHFVRQVVGEIGGLAMSLAARRLDVNCNYGID